MLPGSGSGSGKLLNLLVPVKVLTNFLPFAVWVCPLGRQGAECPIFLCHFPICRVACEEFLSATLLHFELGPTISRPLIFFLYTYIFCFIFYFFVGQPQPVVLRPFTSSPHRWGCTNLNHLRNMQHRRKRKSKSEIIQRQQQRYLHVCACGLGPIICSGTCQKTQRLGVTPDM